MSWIPITFYAIKNNVSISTLRRRIKSGEIAARLEEGRYLLEDKQVTQADLENLQSYQFESGPKTLIEAPDFSEVMNELKQAYAQVLSEKEEQIRQLRVIIRLLESRNQQTGPPAPQFFS